MKVFANTDVGLVRQLNEDDYCIAHNANDEWMAIVCDGIGGAKAGEVASHTAVMTMYEAFMTSLGKGDDVDPTISATITADMEIAARKYSMKFASVLAPRLADAIYKFVSEIGINLSPKGTLLAPQAMSGVLPVTGTASTSTKDIVVI